MLSHSLIDHIPGFFRTLRTRVLVNMPSLLELVPEEGSLLDIGCGMGFVSHAIATARPRLKVLGIEPNGVSLAAARRHSAAPNVEYREVLLEAVPEKFDCILLVDVLHHIPEGTQPTFMRQCLDHLNPGGRIVIADVNRVGGGVNRFMDVRVSGEPDIWMRTPEEVAALAKSQLPTANVGHVKRRRQALFFPRYVIAIGT